jgi:ribosomal protein L11 methyltransferase
VTWYSLRVEPASQRDEALAALFAAGAQGVQEDGPSLVTHFPGEAEVRAAARATEAAAPLARCVIEPAADVDWATAWQAHVGVVSLGRLAIAPSWLAGGLDPSRTVVIEPGMAFGTGDHASTRGAARLLETAIRPGTTVADLGSGSAVLSIVAARLGAARAWAIENDPDAMGNATDNVARNGVGDVVHLLEGDAGLLLPLVAPVDVIVANILSSVIVPLLPAMADALAPGGVAVLAGILASEQGAMADALQQGGWRIVRVDLEEEWWSALVERP